ncbi:hypothetical protein E1301_Tti001239 [Triplophysa tibetana]|uniref:Chondroadherin-like protein n=1 Tax=Triplophysa tibetana TaxID=1572043 RepID=A0A5A9PBZ3_9TELE|nr:hypothetical protein E1301_Tti001239 [Triplophysa tibetana]
MLVFVIEQKQLFDLLNLQCEAGRVQVMSIREHKGKKNLHETFCFQDLLSGISVHLKNNWIQRMDTPTSWIDRQTDGSTTAIAPASSEVFVMRTMVNAIPHDLFTLQSNCDTKLTVTCIGKNLTHIPPTIKEITVKSDLKRNNLGDLSKGAFKHTPYLTHLNLQGCRIHSVREGAFRGLSRLVQLDLTHNNIDILYQVHTRVLELTQLDMIYNPMTYLVEEGVTMPKLTHLFLKYVALQDLSESALSLSPFISHLDLSHNQLHNIQALTGTTQLTGLNLTGNPIRCTCLLRGLKIWTQKSGIKLHGACAWPPHLSEEPLENVQEQDVRCKQQDELMPDDTEKEGEAKTEDEKITPKTNSLKNKSCPKNCHCEVRKSQRRRRLLICRLLFYNLSTSSLRQSDARHATCEERGHFHYLQGNSFPNVPEVVSLHLDGCKIHDIEGGAFQGMKWLMYLYLSDNQPASLDTNIFAGSHDIMYLHLEGNGLSQFPSSEMLAHIPKLLELHLERNLILKLEPVGLLNPIS